MKHYTPTEIKAAVKQQGYKTAALENNKGERIQQFNSTRTSTIAKQLELIHKRLQSDVFEDGIYYILCASSIQNQKRPDKYPIIKGKFNQSMLNDNGNTHQPVIIQSPSQDVLSWEAALSYQKQISDLTNKVNQLQLELNNAQILLEEFENEETNLGDAPDTSIVGYLKEVLPSILPMADRYFDLEEKKLNVQSQQQRQPAQQRPPAERKPITTGRFQHLALIEHYYNSGQDDKFNNELDKLENFNTDLYNQICIKFNIDTTPLDEKENE